MEAQDISSRSSALLEELLVISNRLYCRDGAIRDRIRGLAADHDPLAQAFIATHEIMKDPVFSDVSVFECGTFGKRSLPWLQNNLQHPAAMYCLAKFYEQGIAVPQDFGQAESLLKTAAEMGYCLAQGGLGRCYYNRKEWNKAIELLRAASGSGCVEATLLLGCSLTAKGTGWNRGEALMMLLPIAEQGYSEAMNKVAELYHSQNDFIAAAEWYRRASRDSKDAKFNMACCHAFGHGVPRNKGKMVKWMRLWDEHSQMEKDRDFLRWVDTLRLDLVGCIENAGTSLQRILSVFGACSCFTGSSR